MLSSRAFVGVGFDPLHFPAQPGKREKPQFKVPVRAHGLAEVQETHPGSGLASKRGCTLPCVQSTKMVGCPVQTVQTRKKWPSVSTTQGCWQQLSASSGPNSLWDTQTSRAATTPSGLVAVHWRLSWADPLFRWCSI
eukprot:1012854-Amphidinium_carterae.1